MFKKCPLKKPIKCDPSDLPKFLKEELRSKDENFSQKLDMDYVKLVQWIVKMNSEAMMDVKIPSKDSIVNTEFLKVRAILILTGLEMATDIKRNVKTLILMYQLCGKQP